MKRSVVIFFLLAILLLSGCTADNLLRTGASQVLTVGSAQYPANTPEISLQDADDLDALIEGADFFDYLRKIDISHANLTPDAVIRLEDAYPAAVIDYSVNFCGKTYDGHLEELDLSDISPQEVIADASALSRFLRLEKICIIRKDGTCDYSEDDYIRLRDAVPGAKINYTFELFGQKLNVLATTELSFKKDDINSSDTDRLFKILPYADALSRLSIDVRDSGEYDTCHERNERMAALRDEFPDIKITWRVFYGTGLGQSCMTDVETIWAIGCIGLDPEDSDGFYYCTDVKYMDIGHNSVKNIDFLYNMPDLEVLIIACGEFDDVTAVGSLKKLEYLEVGETNVTDVTPLLACGNLEHLHIGGNRLTDEDVEPLMQMKHLKRLNCANMDSSEFHSSEMKAKFHEAMPDTELLFDPMYGSSFWGAWRYGDGPDGYQPRYALLREQIGYY